MLYFPAKVAERIVVTNKRREVNMTSEPDHTARTNDTSSTRRPESPLERTVTFSPSGPLRVKISTRSGVVRVRALEGNQLDVTLRASSAKFQHLLELATVNFDAANATLEIESQPGLSSGSLRAMRGSPRSWFDFGGSDLDVFVTLPHDSSLEIKTVSGDTELTGVLGDVDVSSASGDVRALDSCRTLEVKTASGDVTTGNILDVLKCRSASGDVRCRAAATKTDIASASGDVDLSVERPGDVVVKAVSGDVHVSVAKGLVVDVNGNTVSGDLGTNIDLDAALGTTNDEEVIFIKVTTVSGDIRVDKAS